MRNNIYYEAVFTVKNKNVHTSKKESSIPPLLPREALTKSDRGMAKELRKKTKKNMNTEEKIEKAEGNIKRVMLQ